MKADAVYPGAFKGETGKFWGFAPWISRVFLAIPILIFAMIGIQYIINPAHAAAGGLGVALTSPAAITDTRENAGFVLSLAILLVYSFVSNSRLRFGHSVVVLSIGLLLALRIFGIAHDGTSLAAGNEMRKAGGEALFLILNSLGLVLQTLRPRS
jgi:hypothetical protein